MRKVFKIVLVLFAAVTLTISIPQFILAFPDLLFNEQHTFKNFSVLSDKKIEDDFDKKLESILFKLRKTGFYNEEEKIKIILCHDDGLTNFFDKISLAPVGAGFQHFTGNIYLFNTRIERFREENAKAEGEQKKIIEYSYQAFNMEDILLHEILHKLHADTLGLWNYKRKMPPPHWKAEGFAEYYTYQMKKEEDSNYDFRERIALYLTYENTFPLFYYKSHLLYEYLAEHEQLSFNDIMQDSITEELSFDKLLKWYNQAN